MFLLSAVCFIGLVNNNPSSATEESASVCHGDAVCASVFICVLSPFIKKQAHSPLVTAVRETLKWAVSDNRYNFYASFKHRKFTHILTRPQKTHKHVVY